MELFSDQRRVLRSAASNLLAAWHWLTTPEFGGADRALEDLFTEIRDARRPTNANARASIGRLLVGEACATHGREAVAAAANARWPFVYALAWLSVAGGNSVVPLWVRHQFPDTGRLVRWLRDTACNEAARGWCRERHNARKELKRWFGFDDFRPEPADADGHPMQQAIAEAAMAGHHVLGILPTGTGKSLCYQIPALSRYDNTGTLTVVISPLVAELEDWMRTERAGLSRYPAAKDRATNCVTAETVPDTTRLTLSNYVVAHAAPAAMVYTDGSASYSRLPHHESVVHSRGQYVDDDCHTNGIESFWSLFMSTLYCRDDLNVLHSINSNMLERRCSSAPS